MCGNHLGSAPVEQQTKRVLMRGDAHLSDAFAGFETASVRPAVLKQGVKLLGLLLTGSTGQHMAGRNGLA
jgi:hypothetical protein